MAGRSLEAIAREHGLSKQHVSRIVLEHERRKLLAEKSRRIAELEAELERLRGDLALMKQYADHHVQARGLVSQLARAKKGVPPDPSGRIRWVDCF